jgi:hypothetical protein
MIILSRILIILIFIIIIITITIIVIIIIIIIIVVVVIMIIHLNELCSFGLLLLSRAAAAAQMRRMIRLRVIKATAAVSRFFCGLPQLSPYWCVQRCLLLNADCCCCCCCCLPFCAAVAAYSCCWKPLGFVRSLKQR